MWRVMKPNAIILIDTDNCIAFMWKKVDDDDGSFLFDYVTSSIQVGLGLIVELVAEEEGDGWNLMDI